MRVTHPRPHRWTKAEYHQMADLGWFDEQRIHGPTDFVSPLAAPSARVAVADVLP